MKKLIFVFMLVLGLAGLSLCHATAECNIVWSGYFYQSPVSGSSPTAETARTQQATYEVFINMYAKKPQEWSNGCSIGMTYGRNGPVMIITIMHAKMGDGHMVRHIVLIMAPATGMLFVSPH